MDVVIAQPESAFQVLHQLDAYQVFEVPRASTRTGSDLTSEADTHREQRLAALVSAYHAGGGAVLLGWRRARMGGPVEVYVGGSVLAGTHAEDEVVLSLPAGARSHRLPPGAVAEAMASLPCWNRITGITDGLLIDEESRPAPESALRPSLEDCLLGVWHDPFAWLVIAEPVAADAVDELAGDTADRQRRAKAREASSPEYAVEAQRLERHHRELSRAPSSGWWQIHLLAASTSPQAAGRVAALVCASADLDGLPYALAPEREYDCLEVALGTTRNGSAPFHAGSALLAAIAKAPAQEVPGIRFAIRPEFDVTPETATGRPDDGVALGQVLDRNRTTAGQLILPRASLNRHTFVCGATGAGKSQTIRSLLETASAQGLPWLVIEPAKAEYRLMAARLADTGHDVVVIRPGAVDALPAGINPLEPAWDAKGRRFSLQTHADLVRALFLAAFESDEPFPQVLSAALTRCYTELGWDLALGEPQVAGLAPRYPTLADLQRAAEDVVTEIGYGKEITDNVRGFIRVRLSSLRLGTPGRFFEGGHQIDFGRLLERNVVFEIEDVGDDRDKAFLMGTVLIRLVEHLRMAQRLEGGGPVGLRHLTVFEEAHRLLRRSEGSGPAAHAVEMFAGLLAEIRAYGEGLVIAEQIPSKLVPDVIKNTAVKIVHRLPAQDDRDAVGATMNITESQSKYLVTLRPGDAAVFTDGMDYPLLVRMADGSAREADRDSSPITPGCLVIPRSVTCGADCAQTPCTLRQMRAAQRALEADPRLVLWAELAVLAHLTGWTMPMPRRPLLDGVRALPVRTRDCALSHAVDAAVATRATVSATRMSPEALAAHVIDAMRHLIIDDERHIGEEPEWLARPYRWCLVWDALMTLDRDDPTADRHPRSAEWAAEHGRPIPGTTNRDQLALVQRWSDNDHRDHAACQIVAFGAETPSAIVTAVGTDPDAPDWQDRLTEQLAEFISCEWPLDYLTINHNSG